MVTFRLKRVQRVQSGFTLIELLIVIAILGILAAAVLVSINPLEQFARGRDSGRLSSIDQLGHAVQSYYTAQNGAYPAQSATWMTTLQTMGEIKTLPTNPADPGYTIGCNTANVAQNGFCYLTNATPDAVVYARAESNSQKTKAACIAGQTAWIVWSSADGKTGLACVTTGNDPAAGITGLK